MKRDYSRPLAERRRHSDELKRSYSRARQRALARLTRRHQDDFKRFYAEEKAKEFRERVRS